jgi:hypothetical protein
MYLEGLILCSLGLELLTQEAEGVLLPPPRLLHHLYMQKAWLQIRIRTGTGFNRVSGSGFGIRETGFRIRIDLMRIRIQHFSNCGSGFRIRIQGLII